MAPPQPPSSPLALSLSLVPILLLLLWHLPHIAAQSTPTLEYLPLDYTYSSALAIRTTDNLQTFNSSLGGIPAPPISKSGDMDRPFRVGGDDFVRFPAPILLPFFLGEWRS